MIYNNNGLNNNEVEYIRKKYGKNEIKLCKEDGLLVKYISHFKEPMISLLLISSFISIVLGEYEDAVSILIAIFIVVTVGFIQEYKSDKTLAALSKLLPPICTCIRNGHPIKMIATELVPGDLVILYAGDRVPADIKIMECNELLVDESSLTGESIGIKKTNCNEDEYNNILLMGTIITHGHAKGIVINIGNNTQFGKLYSLMSIEQSPKSPLKISMEILSKQISIYSMMIIMIIILIGVFQRRNILSLLTMGVSLAVASIPEGLPIIVTVTLALGVLRMAKRNTIVKKLSVVESLGCITVFCADKTGTITTNEMSVIYICTSSNINLHFGLHMSSTEYYETIEKVNKLIINDKSLLYILKGCCLCNNAKISYNNIVGESTECALLDITVKCNFYHQTCNIMRLEEVPFSSYTKFMCVKVCDPDEIESFNEVYYIKGAPDIVLKKCKYFLSNINDISPITDNDLLQFNYNITYYSCQGFRIIGFAYSYDNINYIFTGIVILADPIRPNINEMISNMKENGILFKILTGDSKETSISIAKSILYGSDIRYISGIELDAIIDNNLKRKIILQTDLFYRMTPIQKIDIIKYLRSYGHIIGMIGDGINDSISLKAAHIGISMGKYSSDACKEASDIVLTDDNLINILYAIKEGKLIFKNIQNFVRFQISSSIAALSVTCLFYLLNLKSPLNSTQILWINIIMDGPPAQSLGVETYGIINNKPRCVTESIINTKILLNILLSSFTIFSGVSIVHLYEIWILRKTTTLSFTCFVLFDLFNALNCRSKDQSIFKIGFFTNHIFLYSISISFFGQLLVIYLPFFNKIFHTEPLSVIEFISLLLISSTVFIAEELRKHITYK